MGGGFLLQQDQGWSMSGIRSGVAKLNWSHWLLLAKAGIAGPRVTDYRCQSVLMAFKVCPVEPGDFSWWFQRTDKSPFFLWGNYTAISFPFWNSIQNCFEERELPCVKVWRLLETSPNTLYTYMKNLFFKQVWNSLTWYSARPGGVCYRGTMQQTLTNKPRSPWTLLHTLPWREPVGAHVTLCCLAKDSCLSF